MKKTDAEIIETIIEVLGIKTKAKFSQDLKYKNVNSINQILSGELGISESFILRATKAYPNLNEMFLRDGVSEVLLDKPKATAQKNLNSYTLNDLPNLFLQFIDNQNKTNEILKELLEEIKKQG